MSIHVQAICYLLILLVSRGSFAQEWTRFRGPNGSGVSHATTIPTTWTDADYCWKVQLPGMGHSSPVIWGEKVFLLSADPSDATRYVLCYSAENGSLLWRRNFESAVHQIHGHSSYASSTPAVDARHVYVAWSTPAEITFKAFTHEGIEKWNVDLGSWVGRHGFCNSPIVYENKVILHLSQQAEKLDPGEVPGESCMVALDGASGRELWRTPLVSQQVSYSVPFIYTPPVGKPELVCTSTGNGVFSLDPATGHENWSIDTFDKRTISSPILAGGLIFGSNGSGAYSENYLVAIRPGNHPEVVYTMKNSSRVKAPYIPSVIAQGDTVFLIYDRGFASCIDAPTGKIHWMQRTGGKFSGSPVRVRDKIYAIDEDGLVWVIAADKKELKILAKNDLGEPSRSTLAVAGEKMFLRTGSQLFCVGDISAEGPGIRTGKKP
jgi:outer membrane protein assembly factor BamB